MLNKTITAPKGFLAVGVSCGIKQSGKLDLGLIVCPKGEKAAAVFTTNKIVSAAVEVCREHVKSQTVYAVVVNSGNANTCTGKLGMKNAIRMCTQTAKLIGVDPHKVLVASTGIIGHQVPIEKIISGISKAAGKISPSSTSGLKFTHAIMTTDTRPKIAVRSVAIGGRKIAIAGTAKGAGMIAPNMATALLFITTDANISRPLLAKSLRDAVGNSLNKLTVDGHQSTNDTGIILASGQADNKPIAKQGADYKKFSKALADLCDDLARQMALDAEGATRMFKVVVNGAASREEAAKAARAVADYPLFKCAVNGGDPNWGRIICAVGSIDVKLNPRKLSCKLGPITVFKNGAPKKFNSEQASKIVSGREHTITVDLGAGRYSDFCYGCDLSKGYVTINADYHT